jgi:hypothetical protein
VVVSLGFEQGLKIGHFEVRKSWLHWKSRNVVGQDLKKRAILKGRKRKESTTTRF